MTVKRRMEEGDAAAGMAAFLKAKPKESVDVRDTRQRLAYLIRAELVCCDIYEKINEPYEGLGENPTKQAWDRAQHVSNLRRKRAKADHSWHDICYFGEWAAQLCLTGELPDFPLEYLTHLNEEWTRELIHPGGRVTMERWTVQEPR